MVSNQPLTDTDIAYAVQIAGAFKITKRLRAGFTVQYGKGYQGYLGNPVVGNYVNAAGKISPVDGYGAYAWVRWAWTDTIRSTFMYSYIVDEADNAITKAQVPAGTRHWGQSAHVNVIWSPVPAVNIGAEFIHSHAGRYRANDGTYYAVQVAFQYKF